MLQKEIKLWLDYFNGVLLPEALKEGFKPTPVNAREALAHLTRELVTEKIMLPQVSDAIVPTTGYHVPVRIYNPDPTRALPVLIHVHGGGHVAGSVSVYDLIARKIAAATKHITVSPEYRLAPENPYPAALQDVYGVLQNIRPFLIGAGIKHTQDISLIGDSAGGALVASAVNRAQFNPGIKIKNQILIYPSLDYTMSCESVKELATGYLLTAERIQWYFDQYFQHGEDRKAASPLFGEFTDNMPATLVFTAGYCPLKDEGKLYVQKMRAASVECQHYEVEGLIHPFMNMENLCKTETAWVYQKVGTFLNRDSL